MIRRLTTLLVMLLLTGIAVSVPVAAMAQTTPRVTAGVATTVAEPTPSPTLGATPQPDRAPGDDNDGNWSDYTQTLLAVVAPLSLAVIVGGSVLFYLLRRNRRSGAGNRPHSGGGDSGNR
jgi:hypothetical protein